MELARLNKYLALRDKCWDCGEELHRGERHECKPKRKEIHDKLKGATTAN